MNTLADEFLADLGEDEPTKEEVDDEMLEDDQDMDSVEAFRMSDPKRLTKLLGSERLSQAIDVRFSLLFN